MAHANGIITAPVNTDDVAATLGSSSHDVATLCSHDAINRWAKFKPVRVDTPVDITQADRESVTHGLALGYVASATSAAVNLLANQQTSVPTPPKWEYNKIRPGTDWARLTDFLNDVDDKAPGYDKSAKPPINGFSDCVVFESELGLESKYYPFNFKWGESSHEGVNDTSGIQIPITKLHSTITDGTWRFGMLIYFPVNGKYTVGLAAGKAAISKTLSQPGDMLIRPCYTDYLKGLYQAAFNNGVKELEAIPIIAKDISLPSTTGSQQRWTAQASTKFISMPLGEKIKIKLSRRFENVSLSFVSFSIDYLAQDGTVKKSYTLGPVGGSGMTQTQLVAPSSVGAKRCKIVVVFDMSGTMASSDYIVKDKIKIGLDNSLLETSVSTLEQDASKNGSYTGISQISTLGSRYRMTATDPQDPTGAMSSLASHIENLPRRSSYAVDLRMTPTLSLDGALFLSSNYFYHHG